MRPNSSTGCPTCGKLIPAAVSEFGKPWRTFHEYRIDELKRCLSSKILRCVPADNRDAVKRHLEEEIRQLQDGTWVNSARQSIRLFDEMLRNMKPEELEDWAKSTGCDIATITAVIKVISQKRREELEMAGIQE
jgi:hypothetical protein